MSIYDLFLKNKRNISTISTPPRQYGTYLASKAHVLNAKRVRLERQDDRYCEAKRARIASQSRPYETKKGGLPPFFIV